MEVDDNNETKIKNNLHLKPNEVKDTFSKNSGATLQVSTKSTTQNQMNHKPNTITLSAGPRF